MKKAFLSAAAVVAALALPGSAGHGADQRDHDRHHRHHDRSRGGARHSRTQRARFRAEGNRRRADQGHRARRRRRSDRGDHQCAAVRDRIQGRHHHGLLDDASDRCGLDRRERGGDSAFRPGAVPDQRSAHQVVGRHAAADPDHGQGAVRAHEGARHQDRRLYRLLRFLRRPLGQRLQGPGHSDGNDAGHRGALCPSGYVGRRTGSEAPRRQSGRGSRRRLRHRRGAAADHAARARLQGPDLPDPRRRQHGLHPHRGSGGGRRDHGVGSGDVAGNPARQRADQEAGPGAQHRL